MPPHSEATSGGTAPYGKQWRKKCDNMCENIEKNANELRKYLRKPWRKELQRKCENIVGKQCKQYLKKYKDVGEFDETYEKNEFIGEQNGERNAEQI